MVLRLLVDAYVAALGLVAGSYLNVVIHRLPRDISTILPRSRCPRCHARIRALDNIPLVSYLLLRGRCRSCRSRISWRYPAVEALTAALFVGSLEAFGPTPQGLAAVLFGSLLIALAGIDLEHYLLPDALTWPGLALGLGFSLWGDWISWLDALIGCVVGGGILLALSGAWYLARGEEGLGLGDVKMLAMIGAFLGWQGVLVTLLLSSLAGSLVGLTLIAAGRMNRRGRLPFGVFLSGGALAALFAGPSLVARYAALL